MKISLSRVHYPVTTLGPGRRIGIWFQGCSIRCPGCISSDTWIKRPPTTYLDELLTQVKPWLQDCEGVTISGGEPFEQPDALHFLLRAIREIKNTNILVYSGKSYAELANESAIRAGLIDCLISEPFELSSTQTKHLMGSDNQKMTFFTKKGRDLFGHLDRPSNENDRRLDVMFDEQGTVWIAGIPSRGDLGRLQLILEDEGTALLTTEAKP